MQGDIKYQVFEFWYGSTSDWTFVSFNIGEYSTPYSNNIYIYTKYIYIPKSMLKHLKDIASRDCFVDNEMNIINYTDR